MLTIFGYRVASIVFRLASVLLLLVGLAGIWRQITASGLDLTISVQTVWALALTVVAHLAANQTWRLARSRSTD